MKCFSLFTILNSVRFDFLLIGLPPAPNRKFEALQAAVNALTAAGLKVSFTSHPRQDLCHQAGRHWLWNRLQTMHHWGFWYHRCFPPSFWVAGQPWAKTVENFGSATWRRLVNMWMVRFFYAHWFSSLGRGCTVKKGLFGWSVRILFRI